MFLELLSWMISILIREVTFKYILVQGYIIVIVLLSLFFFSRMLGFFILIKLGVSPFHSWYITVSKYLSLQILWVFITIHKFLPIMMLTIMSDYLLIIILFIVINVALLLGLFTIFSILLFSSSVHLLWRLVLVRLSVIFTIVYWFIYRIGNMVLLSISSFKVLRVSLLIAIMLLIIRGLPPFLFFSMKIMGAYRIVYKTQIGLWVFLYCAVIGVLVYFRGILRTAIQFCGREVYLLALLLIRFQV